MCGDPVQLRGTWLTASQQSETEPVLDDGDSAVGSVSETYANQIEIVTTPLKSPH